MATTLRLPAASSAALMLLALLGACGREPEPAPVAPASPPLRPSAAAPSVAPPPVAAEAVVETADCFLADVPLDPSKLPDPGPPAEVAPGVVVRRQLTTRPAHGSRDPRVGPSTGLD